MRGANRQRTNASSKTFRGCASPSIAPSHRKLPDAPAISTNSFIFGPPSLQWQRCGSASSPRNAVPPIPKSSILPNAPQSSPAFVSCASNTPRWRCRRISSVKLHPRPVAQRNASSREPPASSLPTSKPASPHVSLEAIRIANAVDALHPWPWPRWDITAFLVLSLPGTFSSLPIGWEKVGGVCGNGSHANPRGMNRAPRSMSFNLDREANEPA